MAPLQAGIQALTRVNDASGPQPSVTGFIVVEVGKYPTWRSEDGRGHHSQHKRRFLQHSYFSCQNIQK